MNVDQCADILVQRISCQNKNNNVVVLMCFQQSLEQCNCHVLLETETTGHSATKRGTWLVSGQVASQSLLSIEPQTVTEKILAPGLVPDLYQVIFASLSVILGTALQC